MPDFIVQDHGSVVLVHPQNQAAKDWIKENVDDPQYFGEALVVEPRYLDNLTLGIVRDGLELA
jgi:hypothetical protein